MPIRYRYASKSDLEDVLALEQCFYTERHAPPETIEGLDLFLGLGGKILLQVDGGRLMGGIEFIPIRNMDDSVSCLPESSPLRRVYCLRPSRFVTDGKAILIHGWLKNGRAARWLYKEFFGHHAEEMVGFVSIQNRLGLRLYVRLGGEIIDMVRHTYSSDDVHYVIRKPRGQTVESQLLGVTDKDVHLPCHTISETFPHTALPVYSSCQAGCPSLMSSDSQGHCEGVSSPQSQSRRGLFLRSLYRPCSEHDTSYS